jgi:hypothetical protein
MKRSIAIVFVLLFGASAGAQQPPAAAPANAVVFVTVRVSAEDGTPPPALGPAQFDVTVDGRRRRVVQAQHVRVTPSQASNRNAATTDSAEQYRIGIEAEPADADGNPHALVVRVDAPGRKLVVEAPERIRLPRAAGGSTSAATGPAPAGVPPSREDVVAWERLWGGADAVAAAERASAAVVAARTPAPAPVSEPARDVPAAPASTRFDDLLATYASGDTNVVLRELRSLDDFERVRPELVNTLARWRKDWSPTRAAFAMEVALTAFARRWPNPHAFLNAARDIVTSRPDPPGVRESDDEFERRFHRTAVALLAAVDGPHGVDAYLTSVQSRLAFTTAPSKGPVLSDPRILMAHAMSRETQTLMLLLSVTSTRDDPRTWVVAKNDDKTRRELEEIARLFDAAAAAEDTRAEARVRRAFVLHRLGADTEAAALLDTTESADDPVEYWRALIEGRVFLALDRRADAIAAFERAAMLAPDAQTPAVALMSIFLALDDREQALGWAERARTTTQNSGDPWPQYWSGSARFLSRWLNDLREAPQ